MMYVQNVGIIDRPTVQQAADYYEQYVGEALETLYQKFPRTLVNFIPLFNISGVYWLSLEAEYCSIVHDFFPVECPCAFDSDQSNRQYLDDVVTEYYNKIVKLTNYWQAKNLTEFNVVYQPYSRGLNISALSLDYLSTLDCFHPSLLANEKIAISAWNSLITPFAQKKKTFNPDDPLLCPTASSRFFTH